MEDAEKSSERLPTGSNIMLTTASKLLTAVIGLLTAANKWLPLFLFVQENVQNVWNQLYFGARTLEPFGLQVYGSGSIDIGLDLFGLVGLLK